MSRGMKNFDQFKYQDEYNNAHYDRVVLRFKKGQKELLKDAASRNGQSVNEFITAAIMAKLDNV